MLEEHRRPRGLRPRDVRRESRSGDACSPQWRGKRQSCECDGTACRITDQPGLRQPAQWTPRTRRGASAEPRLAYAANSSCTQLSQRTAWRRRAVSRLRRAGKGTNRSLLHPPRDHRVPARSWYDLAHELTRCAYFERLEDWTASSPSPNTPTRSSRGGSTKPMRTALLCAKARALARLGKHARRPRPRSPSPCAPVPAAPSIRSSSSKRPRRVCVRPCAATLTRGASTSTARSPRAAPSATSSTKAWIDRQRAHRAARDARDRRRSRARQLDITDTAILLSDVATMLGAGHSIDLLAHRMAAILQGTTIGPRVEVESESGCEYQAEPTASWEADADGTFRIRLRGSDRRVAISVAGVAVDRRDLAAQERRRPRAGRRQPHGRHRERRRRSEPVAPRRRSIDGEDSIFRSPRMAELLKIAIRLAATDLPVLISGETGTGKEVIARLDPRAQRRQARPVRRVQLLVAAARARREPALRPSPRRVHRRARLVPRRRPRGRARHAVPRRNRRPRPAIQPKLLRFLERTEIHPVGEVAPAESLACASSPRPTPTSTTSSVQGRFRRDLFYRLGVAQLLACRRCASARTRFPRSRRCFSTRYARECQRAGVRLGDDFIAALLLYDWPGNIRQLANEVRRVVAMAHDGETIRSGALSPDILAPAGTRGRLAAAARTRRRAFGSIRRCRRRSKSSSARSSSARSTSSGGRVAEAAQMLGLSRKGLFLKRRRRGLMARA